MQIAHISKHSIKFNIKKSTIHSIPLQFFVTKFTQFACGGTITTLFSWYVYLYVYIFIFLFIVGKPRYTQPPHKYVIYPLSTSPYDMFRSRSHSDNALLDLIRIF